MSTSHASQSHKAQCHCLTHIRHYCTNIEISNENHRKNLADFKTGLHRQPGNKKYFAHLNEGSGHFSDKKVFKTIGQ